MAFRFYGSIPEGVKADLFPFMEKMFMTVGTATVSTSAEEAKSYRLPSSDRSDHPQSRRRAGGREG